MPFDVLPQEVGTTPKTVSDFMELGWEIVGWNQLRWQLKEKEGECPGRCAIAAFHEGRDATGIECADWCDANRAFVEAHGRSIVAANNEGMPAREIVAALRSLGY